jgi:outer membrane protein assembly factor BamA
MKFGKIAFVALVVSIGLNIFAQTPQQVKILNNYEAAIPFENGKTIITEIVFLGLDKEDKGLLAPLSETTLLIELRYQKATLKVGDKFSGGKVSKAVKTIREWTTSNGYDKAEIIALGEKLPENKMKLIFEIKRGKLAQVSEIRFAGNVNVSSEELIANAKGCIGNSWKIFDARKYDYITQKCSRELMSSKGFVQAEIKNIHRQPVGDNYVVIIEVKEGIRYRIGKIEMRGASVFSNQEVLEMFGQKSGDVINAKRLRIFFYDELNSHYKNKGYLLYDAEIDPNYIKPLLEGQDGVIDLKLTIDEGKQFRIRKISIVCWELLKIPKIRKTLGLVEGEIYNQAKLEQGIKRINDLKEFSFIDKDKDVEMRTDEEMGDIDLVIKIDSK